MILVYTLVKAGILVLYIKTFFKKYDEAKIMLLYIKLFFFNYDI